MLHTGHGGGTWDHPAVNFIPAHRGLGVLLYGGNTVRDEKVWEARGKQTSTELQGGTHAGAQL